MKGRDHSQAYGFSAGLLPRRALQPDTLARNTLDVIVFIHFLFLKIRVNIQSIFSLYVLDIITAGSVIIPSYQKQFVEGKKCA